MPPTVRDPDSPIRSGTETIEGGRSRYISGEVRRIVSKRDGDQCAYVAPDGRRCTQRSFLEFHHVRPFAHDGPATVENISLRCRRHNAYEAELVFGPHGASRARESSGAYGSCGNPPPLRRVIL